MRRRHFIAAGPAIYLGNKISRAAAALGGIVPSSGSSSPSLTFNTRTVNNVDTSSLPATAFWTVGWPFRKGDVPSGNIVTAKLGGTSIPCQAMAIATWGDGSLKWAQLVFDMSGVSIGAASSKDIVLTATSGSWSVTSSRSNSDWTALVDTVEITNLTTTGTPAADMDGAGTWVATFDNATNNTLETYGATSVGLWVSVYAAFKNGSTVHRFLRARMEYLICEKANTTLGPIASRGPFIDNTRVINNSGTGPSNPSEFGYDVNWKRNGVSQRSMAGNTQASMSWGNFCRNDGQWDWTANEPVVVVTQDYTVARKTLLVPSYASGIVYNSAVEIAATIASGVVTAAPVNSTQIFGLQVQPVAVSFRLNAGATLGATGLSANTTYWAAPLSSSTFNLYDTLAHAVAAGATGKLATSGSFTGTVFVRLDVCSTSTGAFDTTQGAGGGASLDISMTGEWAAAYVVGNTQSLQRQGRVQAYNFSSMPFCILNADTNLVPSLLDVTGTPAAMGTHKENSYWGGSNYSSDIGGGAAPTGGLNRWNENNGIEHVACPIWLIWTLEGGTILRDLMYFAANKALGETVYGPTRNTSVNGGSTIYGVVISNMAGGDIRIAAWMWRDVIVGRAACPDGSTMATYLDTVIANNCTYFPQYSNYKGTNFKNLGIWLYDENDYPPSTSRTLQSPSISTFMENYWALVACWAAIQYGDNATYGATLTLMADRVGGLFRDFYNVNCGYYATPYHFGASTSALASASPGSFVSSVTDLGLSWGGATFNSVNYATGGTITVPPQGSGMWWPITGDKFRPTNYGNVADESLLNPPTPLTIGTDYTILTSNSGAQTFTLDNGSGGTQTFGSNVTGSGGWFIPVASAAACPGSGTLAGSAGDPNSFLSEEVATLAMNEVRGLSGASTAYAAAAGRYTGDYNTVAMWGLQGSV